MGDMDAHQFLSEMMTFKTTFQKPCMIYKYLRARWKARPFYLHRNLSYINKHRQQIVVARNKKINVWADKRRQYLERQSPPRKRARGDTFSNGTVSSSICLNGILDEPRNGNKNCFFNWICNDYVKQMTKSKGYICPWCEKDFHFLDSLMMHLRCCHPRFHFSLMERNDETIINISLDSSYDRAYHGFKYPGHDLKQDFKFSGEYPEKRKPGTRAFFFKSSKVCYNDAAIQTLSTNSHHNYTNDNGVDTDYAGRLYYHTTTCLPVKPREVDLDSEADTDPAWLRQRTQLMIDEFTDVNEGEKEILKMWNLHLMSNYRYTADHMMRNACLEFVDKEGDQIISKNLFKNFVLHLVNLFNFGLLSNMDVLNCVRKLRKVQLQEQTQQGNQATNSNHNRTILNVKLTNGLPSGHS